MSFISTFKNAPIDERKELSKKLLQKYPNNIPVIIDSTKYSPPISKHKFIINNESTIGHLMNEIRKYITLDKSQALFVFSNNKALLPTMIMNNVYYANVDEDGFLYIYYAVENFFGF